MANQWDIRCTFCAYKGRLDNAKDAKRHAENHTRFIGAQHKVVVDEIKPLSKRLRVGDRIKVKGDRATALRNEALLAVWRCRRKRGATVATAEPAGGVPQNGEQSEVHNVGEGAGPARIEGHANLDRKVDGLMEESNLVVELGVDCKGREHFCDASTADKSKP